MTPPPPRFSAGSPPLQPHHLPVCSPSAPCLYFPAFAPPTAARRCPSLHPFPPAHTPLFLGEFQLTSCPRQNPFSEWRFLSSHSCCRFQPHSEHHWPPASYPKYGNRAPGAWTLGSDYPGFRPGLVTLKLSNAGKTTLPLWALAVSSVKRGHREDRMRQFRERAWHRAKARSVSHSDSEDDCDRLHSCPLSADSAQEPY